MYQSTPVAWYTATKTSETGIYSPPTSMYQRGPSWIRWAGLGVSKLPSWSGFAPRASQLAWIQGLTGGVLLWNAEHTSLHKPTSTPALQRIYFYLMAKGNQLAKTEVDNIFIPGRSKYFLVYSNQPKALRQKYWFGKSSRLRFRSPEFWSQICREWLMWPWTHYWPFLDLSGLSGLWLKKLWLEKTNLCPSNF